MLAFGFIKPIELVKKTTKTNAAEEQTKSSPSFTSIRITTDTHLLLLKIAAKRLLEKGKQENMDQIVGEIVQEYCQRKFPDLMK